MFKFQTEDKKLRDSIDNPWKHTWKTAKPYLSTKRSRLRIAVDVGSKSGNFSKWLVQDTPRFNHVHMFDMRPKGKYWKNVPRSCSTFNKVALGNRNGTIKHWGGITEVPQPRQPTMHSWYKKFSFFIFRKLLIPTMTAEVRKLDSYEFEGVGLIKIDVEGDELAVLEGAEQTIAREKPVIIVEDNKTAEDLNKYKTGDTIRWLEKRNYRLAADDGLNNYILVHGESN